MTVPMARLPEDLTGADSDAQEDEGDLTQSSSVHAAH